MIVIRKTLGRSMIGAAKKIMMCRPTHYKIKYSINAWMDTKKIVDNKKAHQQWEILKSTIEQCGAEVEVMESDDAVTYPDIVFCANAGIVRHKRVYLSRFANPERIGEFVYYRKFFESKGYTTYYNADIMHEGAGDALWCGKKMRTLISGVGPRSEAKACKEILNNLRTTKDDRFKVVAARLIDPRFYHIDTCFCPLNDHLAMAYIPAFDPVSQNNIQNYTSILPISEEDATKFACNAVVIGKNVILNRGAEKTERMLESHGFKVHPIDMSEFIKAGGSAKCCTLRLE